MWAATQKQWQRFQKNKYDDGIEDLKCWNLWNWEWQNLCWEVIGGGGGWKCRLWTLMMDRDQDTLVID